jgi:hypothetical protein
MDERQHSQVDRIVRHLETDLLATDPRAPVEPPPLPEFREVDHPPTIGQAAGQAIALTCETTADDIEKAAMALSDVSANIVAEARDIAASLRARGDRIKSHIEDFTTLAARVAMSMREAREKVAMTNGLMNQGRH